MSAYRLGYWKSAHGNVGDDLNPWLLSRLLPDIQFADSNALLLCVGSILVSDRWDHYDTKLVLGSGAKSLARLPVLDESWRIRFTRGPRTAAALNAPWISDPALLVARYIRPAQAGNGIGIVPYYRSDQRIWAAVAAATGARLISPSLDIESFVAALATCDRVFCEAMHGAILADAFRIPWRPISFQNQAIEGDTHAFKWTDWTESVELPFDPLVQRADRLEAAAGRDVVARVRARITRATLSRALTVLVRSGLGDDRFVLSADDVFEDRVARMAEVFRDVNAGG